MSAPSRRLELGLLAFDSGAGTLLALELGSLSPGESVEIRAESADFASQVAAWSRGRGHRVEELGSGRFRLQLGPAHGARRVGAERAGRAPASELAARPSQRWGLAARGALVEAGGAPFSFRLATADEAWFASAPELYRAAAAAQWDPGSAIPWDVALEHPEEVEDALVTVLTYLIENETAALLVPARFATQVHPQFREVLQLLALQAADEARHIEVFARRAALRRTELGLSTTGGQASLRTLVEEPDFDRAALLLGVLGEGTFVHLLTFLREHAPDRCTAELMRLVAADEARHVAFAMGHLAERVRHEPTLLARLASAVRERHDVLRGTAGLNEEVFDALVLLAAGSFEPAAIARGHAAVVDLVAQMDAGRRMRLRKLGFSADDAAGLSGLHTRNFM